MITCQRIYIYIYIYIVNIIMLYSMILYYNVLYDKLYYLIL